MALELPFTDREGSQATMVILSLSREIYVVDFYFKLYSSERHLLLQVITWCPLLCYIDSFIVAREMFVSNGIRDGPCYLRYTGILAGSYKFELYQFVFPSC